MKFGFKPNEVGGEATRWKKEFPVQAALMFSLLLSTNALKIYFKKWGKLKFWPWTCKFGRKMSCLKLYETLQRLRLEFRGRGFCFLKKNWKYRYLDKICWRSCYYVSSMVCQIDVYFYQNTRKWCQTWNREVWSSCFKTSLNAFFLVTLKYFLFKSLNEIDFKYISD